MEVRTFDAFLTVLDTLGNCGERTFDEFLSALQILDPCGGPTIIFICFRYTGQLWCTEDMVDCYLF